MGCNILSKCMTKDIPLTPKKNDLTNYLPIVLHWEEKIKHRRIAGFLEKGILAQYHNILQIICNCFGTNILNWGTQIYATVSEQISGWQIFTEFWHNITFTKRRLLGRTSPCQGELLHPESSNGSNGDEESWWERCVKNICFVTSGFTYLPSRKVWQQR